MYKYLIVAIFTAILCETLSYQAWSQPSKCIPRNLPKVSNSINSIQENNVIVIGQVPNRSYVVVIPGNSSQLLNLVRSYVADAFLAENKLGTYVYAGSSAKRTEAECLSNWLRYKGLDARVVYFR